MRCLPPWNEKVDEVKPGDAIEAWRKGDTDGIRYDYHNSETGLTWENCPHLGYSLSGLNAPEVANRDIEFFFYRIPEKDLVAEEVLGELQAFVVQYGSAFTRNAENFPLGISISLTGKFGVEFVYGPRKLHDTLQGALRFIDKWLDGDRS